MSEEKNDLDKINILIAGIKKGCETGKYKFEEIGTLYISVTHILNKENNDTQKVSFNYNKDAIDNIINGVELVNHRGCFSLDESVMLLDAVNYFKNYSKDE